MLQEQVAGVGAFIVVPSIPELGFLTIEEQSSKRLTNKLKGMRSLPMETIEIGENHQQALERLFREEVRIPVISHPDNLTRLKLSTCELTEGVILHAYLIELAPTLHPFGEIGSHKDEVGNVDWTNTMDVLMAKGSLRFRPGVFEVVSSYIGYRARPETFTPFVYTRLRDQVPMGIFDLMEQGISQTEALSRFGLVA